VEHCQRSVVEAQLAVHSQALDLVLDTWRKAYHSQHNEQYQFEIMALIAGQVPTSGYRIPDYSRAAEAAGAAAAAPYQVMQGLIGQYENYKKEQKETEKSIRTAATIGKALQQYSPELAPLIKETLDRMQDPEIPLSERKADADAIGQMVELGTLGTKQRAIAVQEQLANMRTGGGFFGGAAQTRSVGGAYPATSAYMGDMYGAGPLPVDYSGTAASQAVNQFNQLANVAAQAGVDPSKLNAIKGEVVSGLINFNQGAVEGGIEAVKSFIPRGTGELTESRVDVELPDGSVVSGFKDKAGNIVTDAGIIDPQGKPRPSFSGIIQEDIDAAYRLTGDGVLPPIPTEEVVPPGAPNPDTFQGGQGADVQPTPQRGTVEGQPSTESIQIQQPQESKPYAGGYDVLKTSIPIEQMTPEDASVELERTTTLTPFQDRLVNDAITVASQKLESVPTEEVEKDIKFMMVTRGDQLIQPPTSGARVLTEEDKKARANRVFNMGRTRYAQRQYAREILDRFARIQKVLNHPRSSNFFGQNVPQAKLNELMNQYPDIASELETLKGQDLVKSLQLIKERTGTVAQTSDTESKAYQASANSLNMRQSWTDSGAKGELMRLQALLVREGRRLGMNQDLFTVEDIRDPQGRKVGKRIAADEIRQMYADPLYFQDEVDYSNKVAALNQKIGTELQPGQQAPQPQQPEDPYAPLRQNAIQGGLLNR
jgi:hypothetical protein